MRIHVLLSLMVFLKWTPLWLPGQPHTTGPVRPVPEDRLEASFLRQEVLLVWDLKTEALDELAIRWKSDLSEGAPQWSLGYPLDRHRRLFASGEGIPGHWPVSWPGDLNGMVEIKNQEQALEFLRLFSTVKTWYRFPQFGYLEITPSAEQGMNLSGPARMTEEEYKRLGLPDATVVEHHGTFRIRRPVLKIRDWHIEGVAVLDETVTQGGRYVFRLLWYREVAGISSFVQTLPPGI